MGNSNTAAKKTDTTVTEIDTSEPKKFDYVTKPVPLQQEELNAWFQTFVHCFDIQKLPTTDPSSPLTPLHMQYFVNKDQILKTLPTSSQETILLKSFLNQIQSSSNTLATSPRNTIPTIPISDFFNFASLLSKGNASEVNSFIFKFLYELYLLQQTQQLSHKQTLSSSSKSSTNSTTNSPPTDKVLDYDRLVSVFQFLFEQLGVKSDASKQQDNSATPEACALYILQTYGNGSSFVDEKSFSASSTTNPTTN